jgi:para-nitrobenzyl esterase
MRLIPLLTVIAGVSAALGAQAPAPSPQTLPDPVRVEQGLVTGTAGRSAAVRVYRGVPFAAAPSGDLRW